MIYLRHHFMKFDLFNQDPKNIVCFNCEDMTIYSAPPRIEFERKVFWIESSSPFMREDSNGKFVFRPQSSEQAAEFHRQTLQAEEPAVGPLYPGRRAHEAAVHR